MADQVLSVLAYVSIRLSTFLSEKARILGGLRQEVQLIIDEFGHMKAFLQKVAESRDEYDPQLREWIRQVRESAYDTEDVLDEFMLLFARQYPLFGFHGSVLWNFNSINNLPARHQLATKLQSLKGRIKNISEARLRYESHYANILAQGPWFLAANSSWRHGKDDDALLAEEAQLVGIDKPKKHLISQVLLGDYQLKVIAVLGMGGLGKTTLVKKVHDDAIVKNNFQIRAWVSVSQTCDFEKLLKGLIRQLQAAFNEPVLPMTDSMDIYELKAIVKDFLQRARYAIVFDDLWDRESWDGFKCVLPENRFGGNCVILTTRIAEVALASCKESQGYIYKMKHLTFEESWALFCRDTFKDNLCPAHLKDVVEGIVGKCEGLPLAIVAISGLLATKDLSRIDEWERVKSRLGDEFEGTGKLERAKKILRLSYDDLPSTLKTCLLYISIYPEDYEIQGDHLIQLWIAERFVDGKAGLTAEEVAWNHVKELSNRSLIQVSGVSYDRSPFVIHIHDLLREAIISESREQNMMTIVSATQHTMWPSEKVVRRLVIHNNPLHNTNPESHHQFNNLRSLIILGCKEPLPKALLIELLSSKFLKLLNLEGVPLEDIPKEIFNLFHLKYLRLIDTRVKLVPKSIKRLQNLESLDLRGTGVRGLPMEILKLQKLRHLLVNQLVDSFDEDLGCHGFKALRNMGQLLELHTLERVDASENEQTRILNEIGKLVRLRTLAITNLRTKDGKELCSSLEKLTNLRELRLTSSIEKDDMILDLNHCISTSSLPSVCCLSLRGRLEKMPPWISNLQRLGSIKLTWSSLSDDPLESLQHLPNLIEVSLVQVYEGESLCFRAGGFPKLKKLYLKSMKGLIWLRVEEGAMPHIKRLVLQELPLLEELPSGIEHLRELEELELWGMSSQLTMKLESEVFEECKEYEKIAHIPQVLIGFRRDGRWSSRLLFQKKRTQVTQNLDAIPIAGSESDELLFAFAQYFSLPSFLAVALYLLFVVSFFISLFIFTLDRGL